MYKVGLIEDITSAISDVTSLFKGLFDKLGIGDQVPEYPIKSKNTLQKIITDIQNAYPAPTSVAMAKEQLTRAQQQSDEAYAKGGDVNTTYGMIFDKLVQTLKNYISYDGIIPGSPGGTTYQNSKAGRECPDGKNYTDENGMCPSGPQPMKLGFGLIAIIALGAVALSGGLKPKRR